MGVDEVHQRLWVRFGWGQEGNISMLNATTGEHLASAALQTGEYPETLLRMADGHGVYANNGGTLIVYREDGAPPVLTVETADGATLLGNPTLQRTQLADPVDRVRGTASDDVSGLETVTVSFARGGNTTAEVAELVCTGFPPLRCSWSAAVPEDPGVYQVRVLGLDRAGNAAPEHQLAVEVIHPDLAGF